VYKSKVALILQVHDELLFSLQKKLGRERVTKVLSDLASIMQEAGNYYGVPCVCKPEIIEDNWSEAMKLQDWRNN
jgi:DNA polymerase I-like protein with 3'-5' exonuclease and polymerase domains